MARRIRDLLANDEADCADGRRERELARLAACLDDAGPVVVWLAGQDGTGKQPLLSAFAGLAAERGADVLRLDCRTIEPTAGGLLAALGEMLGRKLEDLAEAAAALQRPGLRRVILFENYEVFRLADPWLRREFIPALSADARVVFSSREPPAAGWTGAAEWRDYFTTISLSTAGEIGNGAVEPLSALIRDPELLEVLRSVSVARRITRPLVEQLAPGYEPGHLYERLAGLPYVERRRDGLAIEESLHARLGTELQAADPEQYRDNQRTAWQLLRRQLLGSSHADLWRFTADVIFLIENPVIREAFFPSESARYSVEPSRPDEWPEIARIVELHDPPDAAAAIASWWKNLPRAFHSVRDAAGELVGFYCMTRPAEVSGNWIRFDPVAKRWLDHLAAAAPREPEAVLLRRWMGAVDGEAPGAVQAAAWVDIKRTYLELRPRLRRVYLTLENLAPYAAVANELGFAVLGELAVSLNDKEYHTAMLDFGPGSVDGWICKLVAAELGVSEDSVLDKNRRQFVRGQSAIPLTPLEYGVLELLEARRGRAISRDELLGEVWGRGQETSNVVDAVVRGLRKKLGDQADLVETVRGVGYRLRE